MSNQQRLRGRFAKKNIIQWKNNMSDSMKKKHSNYKKVNIQSTSGPQNKSTRGRRLVDFEKLAEDMWCKTCDIPLSFRFLIKEDIIGIASIFHIKCQKCDEIYRVTTSATDENGKYHVNFKLVLAMLDGGIGETQLNTILSTLNMPTVHHSLIKQYENERLVGPAIETVAKETCHEALKIEKQLPV